MSEKTESFELCAEAPTEGEIVEAKPAITVYRPQFVQEILKPGTAVLVRAAKSSSWGTYKHQVNAVITRVAALELTFVYFGPALDRYNSHHDNDMEERSQTITIDELTNESYQIEVIREAKA